MSYILEALKKSERERQKDGVPDLYTDHSPSSVRGRKRRKPAPKRLVIVGGLVVIAVGIGGWQLWQKSHEETVQRSTPVTIVKAAVPVSEKKVTTPVTSVSDSVAVPAVVPEKSGQKLVAEEAVVVKKKIIAPKMPEAGKPVGASEQSAAAVSAPVALSIADNVSSSVSTVQQDIDYPLLEELAVSVRSRIPDLTFAGHVYSDDVAGRMIIINNRIVREGDPVGSGLALQQITRDGVVMQFEDSVFKVNLF